MVPLCLSELRDLQELDMVFFGVGVKPQGAKWPAHVLRRQVLNLDGPPTHDYDWEGADINLCQGYLAKNLRVKRPVMSESADGMVVNPSGNSLEYDLLKNRFSRTTRIALSSFFLIGLPIAWSTLLTAG